MGQAGSMIAVAGAVTALTAWVWSSGAALAQAAGPTLAGKTVNIIVGFGPGGGYDLWARTISRHIGKHLPGNPGVVVQNMPGAGSFLAANHIYSVAPKDGSVFAIVARDAPMGPILNAPGAKFDPLRFTWLGTPAIETNVCIVHKRSPVKTFEDMQSMELILGDNGPGTGTRIYPLALNGMLNTKFKLVSGFPSSGDVLLAMERGEVDGICESYESVRSRKGQLLDDGTLRIVFQAGSEVNPKIGSVPDIFRFAKTQDQRQALTFLYAGQGLGRPFFAPPDLPADVARMLQTAFTATMKDGEFAADAANSKLELDARDGPYLANLLRDIYSTPKPLVDRISALIK